MARGGGVTCVMRFRVTFGNLKNVWLNKEDCFGTLYLLVVYHRCYSNPVITF